MSLVVSDRSPLRALYHLGEHSLLHRLYGTILIPLAVAQELAVRRGNSAAIDVSSIAFVTVRVPSDHSMVQKFMQTLDRGESEAIAPAIEVSADAVLMDELAGRAIANGVGLNCVGVLGILGRAKREGLIAEVKPRIDRLRSEIHFFLSDSLYDAFLKSANE